jgi:hypothetical protein
MTAATVVPVLSTTKFSSNKQKKRARRQFVIDLAREMVQPEISGGAGSLSERKQSHQKCIYYKWISTSSENNGGKFREERKTGHTDGGKARKQITYEIAVGVHKDHASEEFLCSHYIHQYEKI